MPHTSYKCVPRCHITAPDRLPLHPLFLPSSSPRPFLLSGGRTSARCVFHGLPFHFIETAIRLLHCIINLATVCFFHLKASFLLSQHAFCREVIHSKSIWSLRVRDILFYCFFFSPRGKQTCLLPCAEYVRRAVPGDEWRKMVLRTWANPAS